MALYLDQTTATPLWNLDLVVSFDPAVVPCPAIVEVIVDGITSSTVEGCGSVTVRLPVFTDTRHLQPNTSTHAEVFVNGQGSDHLVEVPPAPVWVGAGDGLTAGAHQSPNHAAGPNGADLSFAYVSHAVATLNHRVPARASVWDMTAVDVAVPGATTRSMVQTQLGPLEVQLATHRNSWNVFSLSGGLDDTSLPSQLNRWYATQCNPRDCAPWQPARGQSCLAWADVQRGVRSPRVGGQIARNLAELLDGAVFADPEVRRVEVLEPGLVDRFIDNRSNRGTNPCYGAATAAIGALDSIHVGSVVLGRPVQIVDPRLAFGSADVPIGLPGSSAGLIQTTTPSGYPNPGAAGQAEIAALAAKAVGA